MAASSSGEHAERARDVAADPGSIDLGQARATGTRRAQQGAPLPEVLRAFRIGFSALWDLLLDVASGSGEPELGPSSPRRPRSGS